MLLRVEGLRKSFPTPSGTSRVVLSIDAFSLDRGERVAVQGPSGSGKSTFLHCLAGILPLDAGRIHFENTSLASLSSSARDRLRARQIGLLRQRAGLFPQLTVTEHLRLIRRLAGQSFDAATADLIPTLGLAAHAAHRPGQLSQGQQQRLALACTLAREPALILADEPTAHLDPVATGEVLATLFAACAARAIGLLFVTHDPAAAAAFDTHLDWVALNPAAVPA